MVLEKDDGSLRASMPASNASNCLSVKSEPVSPTKSLRGSPGKSYSRVKGPAIAKSKILNMDLTGWDEVTL